MPLSAGARLGHYEILAPLGAHLQMETAPADRLVGSMASVRPSRTAMALSPDGRQVVFAATRGTVTQLFARGIDRADAAPVPGTEGAVAPFFSPDGAWIGFWADGTIKKVPIAGGPAAAILDQPVGRGWGASWGEDGTLAFASGGGIFRVSSDGGTPVAVTTPDASKGQRHLLPHPLPGGNAILFTEVASEDWDSAAIVLRVLDTAEQRVLVPGGADARYVGTGHIVYMKTARAWSTGQAACTR